MGIDVDSRVPDLHVLPQGQASRHTNDAEGIGGVLQLARDLKVSLGVTGSTNGLESSLAPECGIHQIPAVAMNSRQVRDFARSIGKPARTDAIDAHSIRTKPTPQLNEKRPCHCTSERVDILAPPTAPC